MLLARSHADALERPTPAALSALAADGPLGDADLLSLVMETGAFRPLLIIGDSHVHAYRQQSGVLDVGLFPLAMVCTGGSAKGLSNPLSVTGYGERIERMLERAAGSLRATDAVVMFKFGQVDVEFVHDFDRVRTGRLVWRQDAFAEFSARVIEAYSSFLACTRERHLRDVTVAVCSIFPPTLADSIVRRGYVNGHLASLHADGTPDLQEQLARLEHLDLAGRTRAHAAFNDDLRAMADRQGFVFIDDFTPAVSAGVIRPELTAETGGSDHHIYPTNPVLRAVVEQALRAF